MPFEIRPLQINPLQEEQSLWERANAPLTIAPSDFAKHVGDSMTEHSLDESMLGSQLRGFGAGALQGLGDLVSGLTSPAGIATTLLTAGEGTALKAGLPTIAKALGYGAKAAGGLYAAHGAGEVGEGTMEGDWGRVGRGITEVAGGTLGMRGVTPKTGKVAKTLAKSDELIADIHKNANIKMNNAAEMTPEGFSGINEFMGNGADEAELAAIRTGASKKPVDIRPLIAKAKSADAVGQNPSKIAEGIYDEFKTYREVPVGTTYKVSPKDMPRKKLNEAIKLGFDFVEIDNEGRVVIKKTKESPAPDLVETSPGQLGVKTDMQKSNKLVEAFNFPRGMMASVDFSAPLRQGIGLIHKKEFWKALPDMFKAWSTEQGFREIQTEIANRPAFRKTIGADGKVQASFAEKSGLSLTDLTDLSKREEAIMSTWAEKVPLVRRSNRAYTAFLNKLRADTFDSLISSTKSFGVDTKTNLPLARSLAEFVNVATGRGNLGSLERAAVPLNTLLFSPRLMAARLKMLDPRFYLMGPKPVRMEAIKSLFAIAAAGNIVTQLGKLAGGSVENDPNSSDFGKLRIGNTRVDPYAGFQQYIVAANRLIRPGFAHVPGGEGGTDTGIVPIDVATGYLGTGGQKVASSQSENEYELQNPVRPFDPTHKTVAERFLRGKAHPVLGFAWSLMDGAKELSGEHMDFGTINPMENAISQRFIPILMQDIYELSQTGEISLPTKIAVGLASSLGMGTQTYGEEN